MWLVAGVFVYTGLTSSHDRDIQMLVSKNLAVDNFSPQLRFDMADSNHALNGGACIASHNMTHIPLLYCN